jgi:hypothetical protein
MDGMDVIDSGPERPAGRGGRALRRALAAAARRTVRIDQRQRHTAVVLACVLAAAGSVAALRAGLPQPARAHGPIWTVRGGPPYDLLPGRTPIPPPRLISEDGQGVAGELPATTLSPSRPAVGQAVALVLGRYCRTPATHTVRLIPETGLRWEPGLGNSPGVQPGPAPGPLPLPLPPPWPRTGPPGSSTGSGSLPAGAAAADNPWRFAVALVTAAPSGSHEVTLTLRWTGYTYRWRGSLAELNHCD